mmetsp:Transcript_15867/g.44488  ORF Transcript_15867/g.44488 Transcript_15867/m.44488 type:complete len:81 (+) Transcript_15867:82-324(+)
MMHELLYCNNNDHYLHKRLRRSFVHIQRRQYLHLPFPIQEQIQSFELCRDDIIRSKLTLSTCKDSSATKYDKYPLHPLHP